MKKDNNSCIRLDRDKEQIERCKRKVGEIAISVSDLSKTFSLVGNEVRMKILFLLQEEGKLCVCDLSEILDMKVPAVSQHLRKMKDAKLVHSEREGTVIFYHISHQIKSTLNTILNLISEPAF